tara:strand:- start:2618 stop:3115 length:498 start_codon:yes stop_codon:yes gene_type:complete
MKSSHPTGLHYFHRNPHPKKERHGDCGVRAICLALDLPYNKVWRAATKAKRQISPYYYDQWGQRKKSKVTATWSLSRRELERTLSILDFWNWNYYRIPSSKTDRAIFKSKNFPRHCIAHQNRHWVAVKNDAIWDSWDSRGKRNKELKGYFATQSLQEELFPKLYA